MKKILFVSFCALVLLGGTVFAEDVKDVAGQAENAAVLVANEAEKTVHEAEKAVSAEMEAIETEAVPCKVICPFFIQPPLRLN